MVCRWAVSKLKIARRRPDALHGEIIFLTNVRYELERVL